MSYLSRNGQLIIGIMWLETMIAFILVVLRIYSRARLVRNIGWDDHLISISMVLFFCYTIACTVGAFNGMGSHAADLGPVQTVKAIKWEIAAQTFNIAAIATSKSSVAVFLIRLVSRRLHIQLLWFCVFSTTFVCASCIVFMYTQCTPLESILNPTIPHTCYLNFTANAIFSGSYTAAMDFALAIFPWFLIWNLNMKRKERLTIVIGLSLGIFAGICGVVRAVQLEAISGKADYTYLTVPLILWGSTELLVCIACASIPVLRPLYKQIRGTDSSSVPYELGEAPSRQLDGSTKNNKNNSHLTAPADRRLSDTFVAQYSPNPCSIGTSRTTSTDGVHENHSDEDITLPGWGEGSGLSYSDGIRKTTQVIVV